MFIQRLFHFSTLVLSFLSLTVRSDEQLQIITTYKPEGCEKGPLSVNGERLAVHYTGSIDESSRTGTPGQVFDSSIWRNKPFDFVLGAGEVIKGWDQGLLGMCEQEKRTLIIPPSLGYGNRGAGQAIPGDATLKFTVECLLVGDGSSSNEQQSRIKTDGSSDLGPFAMFAFILFGFFVTLAMVLLVIVLWKRFRKPTIASTAKPSSHTAVVPTSVYSPIEHAVDEEEIVELARMLPRKEASNRSTTYRDEPPNKSSSDAMQEMTSTDGIRLEENKLEEIKV